MATRTRLILLAVAGVIVWGSLVPVHAQGVDDSSWQRKNDRGNRYEGRIDIPVSRPDLELLSFVGFREDFYDDEVELNVRFYLPEGATAGLEYRLLARELKEDKQYGMLAKPERSKGGSWNTWGPWSTAEYLVKHGIPGWNLGYIVLLEEKGRVAPALVYYSSSPKRVENYKIDVRANSRLKQIRYDVLRDGKSIRQGVVDVEEEAGAPIRLALDVRGISPGPLKLSLQGKYQDKPGRVTREYRFYHQPVVSVSKGTSGSSSY